MKKHVRIDAPLPGASRASTSTLDCIAETDILPPQPIMLSAQEGYRTPTIEDYEQARSRDGEKNKSLMSHDKLHARLPVHSVFWNPSARSSTTSLGDRILDKLQWRERLRHFTWSFFSMTMVSPFAPFTPQWAGPMNLSCAKNGVSCSEISLGHWRRRQRHSCRLVIALSTP